MSEVVDIRRWWHEGAKPAVFEEPPAKRQTWQSILRPTDRQGPFRGIFWSFYNEDTERSRIRPHWCPAYLVPGIVEYVRESRGFEPVEILIGDTLSLDPGGMVLAASEQRQFDVVRWMDAIGRVYPPEKYVVPLSMVSIMLADLEHPSKRTIREYAVPDDTRISCFRWTNGHTLSVVPHTTASILASWLRRLVPEEDLLMVRLQREAAERRAARGGT